MEAKEAVADTILRTISVSPTKTLAGGQVHQAIRACYPSFRPTDHGARNLREFIRIYVLAVKEESRRAGMDIVYGLRDAEPVEPTLHAEETSSSGAPPTPSVSRASILMDQRVWKAFASPSSPWRLFLQSDTGTVRSLAPNESPDPSWVPVPPCSAEALQKIAQDFVNRSPEPFRPVLTRTLTERKWWFPFFEVLRNVGLKTSWIGFRRDRIAEEFERTISALVQERRACAAPPREPARVPPSTEEKLPLSVMDDALLRQLAVYAISRMNQAELRALNIPLGYVVDSLGSNR